MTTNLASQLNERLPAEPLNLLRVAGKAAAESGLSLYLVGGAVRDLLLGQDNFDLDLVVEGDAPALANLLATRMGGQVVVHRRFGTAKLRQDKMVVDLATARAETYARPGALPAVQPSSLVDDLSRRDFSVNAMAVHLHPASFGKLVDPFDGEDDLQNKRIRVLHSRSFIDDATRMLRAIRYEQRFDFHLEAATEQLLRRDLSMLHTVSGDRIRRELELTLKEAFPEKALRRASTLGLLTQVHPSLKGNGWIAETFHAARSVTNPPPAGLYLSLLVYHVGQEEGEDFVARLRMPKSSASAIRDSLGLREKLALLDAPELLPSAIHRLLQDYSPTAITANFIASDSPLIRERLRLYLDRLRYVKTLLTGQDLQDAGLPPGPQIGETLRLLLDARLDQRMKTREQEMDLVRARLSPGG